MQDETNADTAKFGSLEVWKFGSLEVWKFGKIKSETDKVSVKFTSNTTSAGAGNVWHFHAKVLIN